MLLLTERNYVKLLLNPRIIVEATAVHAQYIPILSFDLQVWP